MSGASVGDYGVLVVAVVVNDGGHGRPRVLDVVKVAPQVARLDDGRVVRLRRESGGRKKRLLHNCVLLFPVKYSGILPLPPNS